MQNLDKKNAGPSLRALAAAAIGRVWVQLDVGGDPHDYSMSGVWTGEIEGLTVTRSNVISVEPPEIYSRVTWEINQVDDSDSCCLVVTHDQMREGANPQLYGGWPMILSGLKTYLETGDVLTTPGSLMYNS